MFSEILDSLKDEKRFLKLESKSLNSEKSYFYDSFYQTIYAIDKEFVCTWETGDEIALSNFVEKSSIEKKTSFLNFCNLLKTKKEDVVPELSKANANVMINTSNRCNLNCSYCYRAKQNDYIPADNEINQILDFSVRKYKPNAEEFSISYSMSSESSVDLPLLKKFANLYPQYESYFFTEDDLIPENKSIFLEFLRRDFFCINLNIPFPKNPNEIIEFLNALLKIRELVDILGLTKSMFNSNDWDDVSRRYILAEWKYYRLNRWCLEIKYDRFIKKKRNPYVGFWFMSNGTNASAEYINFIKSVKISPFWISIDGPKNVHDYNRIYNNGNGSYKDVIKNIKTFLNNDMTLKASSVLTSYFPKPLEIATHLLNLGFSEISMTPIRPNHELSFDMATINDLIAGYEELFTKLEQDALAENFSLFHFLAGDLSLAPIHIFLSRTKLIQRCEFDNQIVILPNGTIFPCLYFSQNEQFLLGNIKEGISNTRITENISVNDRAGCELCVYKYLCGGTCFYGSFVSTGDYKGIDFVECKLKKYLCKRNLELLIFFMENNIPTDNIR